MIFVFVNWPHQRHRATFNLGTASSILLLAKSLTGFMYSTPTDYALYRLMRSLATNLLEHLREFVFKQINHALQHYFLAYKLFSLKAGPYFHTIKAPGKPITTAATANMVLPTPKPSASNTFGANSGMQKPHTPLSTVAAPRALAACSVYVSMRY